MFAWILQNRYFLKMKSFDSLCKKIMCVSYIAEEQRLDNVENNWINDKKFSLQMVLLKKKLLV